MHYAVETYPHRKDGFLLLELIDAFLSVLEHLVAHEIVHFLHRNHGDSFWQALLVQYIPSFVMPDIMYTSDSETCGMQKMMRRYPVE